MNISVTPSAAEAVHLPNGWVPPLENGDRLTRDEFERRYQVMPEHIKAELIDGVVHMSSPVRVQRHGKPHARIMAWLGYYEAFTPHVAAVDNSTVRLDEDNESQPDASLFLECGDSVQAVIDADDYIAGAPEWIGEIASSSVSIDLGAKFRVYERNGVQEYLVWRVLDRQIDWFVLQAGKLEPLAVSPEGYFKSRVFPGLWLDSQAMIAGDMARVFQVLQEGLSSPEHRHFVARLREQQPG